MYFGRHDASSELQDVRCLFGTTGRTCGQRTVLTIWHFTVSCFHAGFFLDLFFDHEDGSDVFLRNVGGLSIFYTALFLKRSYVYVQTAIEEDILSQLKEGTH
jgi:hypothetical protein